MMKIIKAIKVTGFLMIHSTMGTILTDIFCKKNTKKTQ